ncbi:protein of unknown function DUF6 transmembrane [Chloroherpeton thalassium ATCC 35110]|uniref:EamA domain-containing protein n=1 Tax=Chloroherpeton thalassium (strain ATCC 35110 / GB-78) TaxID=517418 RepID=B3QW71_CHLT3|nr:DMT family transporter [Chloroherpeton thalassium]ACF13184.1 protein of unknown function DUF6 transmembrane [Chloroherpeton thalassium ATCC 35110]
MLSPEGKNVQTDIWKGMMYVAGAAILWSTGGVLIKSISLNACQISFWRAMFATFTIFAIVKPKQISSDITTLFAAVAYAATLILFVVATKLTTAANAILLQYTAPIYVGLFGWLFLKERVSFSHIVTMGIGFIGMAIFFVDGLSTENHLGNLAAIFSGLGFGVFLVLLRKKSDDNPIDSVLIGNGLIMIFCASAMMFSAAQDPRGIDHTDVLYGFAISTADSVMVAFLGILQIGIPYVIFSRGIAAIPALDASLLSMLEPVLNPIWVLLFVGEIPSFNAIIGGAILLAAVAFQSYRTGQFFKSQEIKGN